MPARLKRITVFVFLIAFIILCLTFSPFSTYPVRAEVGKPQVGETIAWIRIKISRTTKASLVIKDALYTKATIYAPASGQPIWHNISKWYRVPGFNNLPLYIYSKLVIANRNYRSTQKRFRLLHRKMIVMRSKLIVVSLSKDRLYAYQGGRQVFSTQVITGRSTLPTPTGTFHVFAKLNQATFYSPWPKDSPYWYVPTHINYALEFLHGGYYLHDSWWHTVYGPGTNNWHYDPVYGWQWGTHGCVAMTDRAASWLYHWAPVGIKVQIDR